MKSSYTLRSGAGTSAGASPDAIRLAMMLRAASSIGLPWPMMCSAALQATSKPQAAPTRSNKRNVALRRAESCASIRVLRPSGKSPRTGDSPHARGLRANAGSSDDGLRTVPACSP